MVRPICFLFVLLMPAIAMAHHPDRMSQPVQSRGDLIGPLGNQLPPGHRRVYNRPGKWAGKIAYWIAPSSQEAMTWHRDQHAGLYPDGLCPDSCPRTVQQFFYPKPWESLRIGARPKNPADIKRSSSYLSEDENVAENDTELVDESIEDLEPKLEMPQALRIGEDAGASKVESLELIDEATILEAPAIDFQSPRLP